MLSRVMERGIEMVRCKSCHSEDSVKNGRTRGVQRYRCNKCSLNFVYGDRRQKPQTPVKKVILYSPLGKTSFSMLGKILSHAPSIIYRWIVEAMDQTQEPQISSNIQEIECAEMWHFLQKKSKALDHQSRRSWHRANCGLGYRES